MYANQKHMVLKVSLYSQMQLTEKKLELATLGIACQVICAITHLTVIDTVLVSTDEKTNTAENLELATLGIACQVALTPM